MLGIPLKQEGKMLSALRRPIQIRNLLIRNRTLMAPMGTRFPAPEIYHIGDCRQPGKIMQAIHDGNRIGRTI